MASNLQVFEDDEEEFDWDAAVREIDVACLKTAANTPQTPPPPPPPPPPPVVEAVNFHRDKGQFPNLKLNKGCRQLSLDKFINNDVGECGDIGKKEIHDRGCFVDIDPLAAQTWIYPDNVPRRDYQLAIAKTALFSNTLVALPTGLGKTLIAAVVMYNYFRWFPEGKIVFAAPSRPLVMQQIEACHNIVGIPQEWTIDMTGLTSPPKRASLWRSKRVFFVTPQVLEKDIQSGACMVNYLVCLVIDEAHRAMGNYAYCVAVRELMAVPVELRILALTATPGSKQQTIQLVIDNLQISTLEYRNENDHDVFPYVHNRKIELIEVPMGKNATEINDLILEAIRPIAARLSAMGLLQNRDVQTLSPCDLLNSRDKFRQAPPPELSDMRYSEVEGYFGVLITLYHIRKLLSSHGIRPAHEMLEEKLRQGYFARLMSRNEAIQKARLIMQQNVSHGAPSPKLSKMIEILQDHFKTNDPQHSRVIIFSNFRGSVRDILDSFANIGNLVKATQFIGQSSGKTLKGQTQKVQQAVLEKFRSGGYNVIVATSIGEEGLDIMEVDLVICFDANISPLRMIQRMGRTGRKHDGRVVVLACEGTELKGYLRKQATGKAVKKHMRNGGVNSFHFHPSSRMIPHSLKPELQFEELSIEKFVRHTKKVKNDCAEGAASGEKLTITADEAASLNKYFSPVDKICKPSLVAFPHFQAFPSRVHRVMHSSRTGWFIDVMQTLHGLAFSMASRTDVPPQSWCLDTGSIEQDGKNQQDFELVDDTHLQKGIRNHEVFPSGPSLSEKHKLGSPGSVSEIVVPCPSLLPFERTKVADSCIQHLERSQVPTGLELLEATCSDSMPTKTLSLDEETLNRNAGIGISDTVGAESPALTASGCGLAIIDADLSPRLTNFIQSGLVPESPLSNIGMQSDAEKEIPQKHKSPSKSCASSSAFTDVEVVVRESPQIVSVKSSPEADGSHMSPRGPDDGACGSPPTSRTPLHDLTNSSCSRDWRISSGEKSGIDEKPTKFRRLRKIGDLENERSDLGRKGKSTFSPELVRRFTGGSPYVRNHRKVKRLYEDARDFIDEEAEVSSEDVVPDSEDEGNQEDSDAYEDSFIDDRVEPTASTSQIKGGKVDMMGIYSPRSVASITSITESGDCSGKTNTLQTPQGGIKSPGVSVGVNSVCSHMNIDKTIHNNHGAYPNEANNDSWKGISSSTKPCPLPPKNLEKEFCFHVSPLIKELPLEHEANGVGTSFGDLSDDFYEGIDLDELEAQAAQLISQKKSVVNEERITEPCPQENNFLGSPSFDLGIS